MFFSKTGENSLLMGLGRCIQCIVKAFRLNDLKLLSSVCGNIQNLCIIMYKCKFSVTRNHHGNWKANVVFRTWLKCILMNCSHHEKSSTMFVHYLTYNQQTHRPHCIAVHVRASAAPKHVSFVLHQIKPSKHLKSVTLLMTGLPILLPFTFTSGHDSLADVSISILSH